MNEKYKKRIPKVLPVGIAMGILFSASPLAGPLTENKVKADVDTFGTIVTTFGKVYDAFLAEPFGKWLEEIDVKTTYKASNENVAYKAPTFQKGEFGISAFDFYKDKNFSKKVKIAYANGKVEYKTIKHGEQVRIKDAGTIVDLTPDEADLSKHDILYITQKQLDEGNTGVSLTNFKTYYLKSDNSGGKNVLADRFERQEFPNAFLSSGLRDIRYVNEDLFSQLPEEKRKLATITSQPVGKEVLSNYVTNDSETFADFNNRLVNVFADTKLMLETSIGVENYLLDAQPYQIIPIKKGSNKVIVKKGLEYLSGKEGTELQYSWSIGNDEILELVPIEDAGTIRFDLINKNGAHLTFTNNISKFTTDKERPSNLRFTAKTDTGLHNWLREWYPGKENEKHKHDGIEIEWNNNRPQFAKDSSGNVIKNSWVKSGDVDYYAGSDGIFLTGWQEIEGKTYYFGLNATLVTDSGQKIDGNYYNFNDDGSIKRSAWSEDRYGLHYSDASGVSVKNGLREIDGKIYHFEDYNTTTKELRLEDQHIILHFSGDKGALEKASGLNGEALSGAGTYVTLEGKKVVFEKDGSIRKNGVSKIFVPSILGDREDPAIVYYSLEDGPFYTGWKEIEGKKYYFNNGKNYDIDCTRTIDGKKYYFNQEGQALPTGFIDIDGIPYYLNDKSEKVTGLHKIDGKLYLFSEGDKLRVYGEKVRNTIYGYDGNRYYTDHTGVISQNFKGYVYSHNRDYYIETNNEGVITKIWQR